MGLIGPLLGAIADHKGNKKGFLAAFLALGLLSTGAMYFIERGDWRLAAVLFVLGNIGITSTLAFYNSLLPGIASADEVDGDLLAARLRDKAVTFRATVAWQQLVGAVGHKSAQQ